MERVSLVNTFEVIVESVSDNHLEAFPKCTLLDSLISSLRSAE